MTPVSTESETEKPPAPPAPQRTDGLERDFDALEAKFEQAVGELRSLRARLKEATAARDRAMKSAWADLDHRWFTVVLAAASLFFILSFYVYSHMGQAFDARPLPHGEDPLLARLPVLDLVPLLTYGWLVLHVAAWATWVVYQPRRIPYFLSTIGLFVLIRTVFVALNPVGAPVGMINLNASYLLSPLRGVLAFDNEFFFSGHTAIPYLYYLFSPFPGYRRFFLAGSLVMGAAVLLTRNHYVIDVLGAYFMTYAIFALSRRVFGFLDPAEEAR